MYNFFHHITRRILNSVKERGQNRINARAFRIGWDKFQAGSEATVRENMEERAERLALYIIENQTTVRAAAQKFGISKSTVHMDDTKWNGLRRA